MDDKPKVDQKKVQAAMNDLAVATGCAMVGAVIEGIGLLILFGIVAAVVLGIGK